MNITDYLKSRHKTIDASIAAEVLAGNQFKEACERAAKAEITALECAIGGGEVREWIGEVPEQGTTWTREQIEKYLNEMRFTDHKDILAGKNDALYDAIQNLPNIENYITDPETGIKAVTEWGKG